MDVVLRTRAGAVTAEDSDDLRAWLRDLVGGLPVTHTVLAVCASPTHADPATWFYVEADPEAGLARRRCVGCGTVAPTLDSEDSWSYPPTFACLSCGQSMVEVGFGVHAEPPTADHPEAEPTVTWAVLAARCVACGRVSGLTDLFVADLPLNEAASRL